MERFRDIAINLLEEKILSKIVENNYSIINKLNEVEDSEEINVQHTQLMHLIKNYVEILQQKEEEKRKE